MLFDHVAQYQIFNIQVLDNVGLSPFVSPCYVLIKEYLNRFSVGDNDLANEGGRCVCASCIFHLMVSKHGNRLWAELQYRHSGFTTSSSPQFHCHDSTPTSGRPLNLRFVSTFSTLWFLNYFLSWLMSMYLPRMVLFGDLYLVYGYRASLYPINDDPK